MTSVSFPMDGKIQMKNIEHCISFLEISSLVGDSLLKYLWPLLR